MLKKIFLVVGLGILGAGMFGLWAMDQIRQLPQQSLQISANQELQIKRGTNSKILAKQLEQANIINSTQSRWLPWFFKINPQFNNIKAGTYALDGVHNLGELLQLLNSGKEIQLSAKLLDGLTFKDWQKVIAQLPRLQKNLAGKDQSEIYSLLNLPADTGNTSLEGWLYPDTYQYSPDSTELELLKRASSRLQKELNSAWQERDADLPLKSPYEMLILASIVQKESGFAEEQPLVASVFINRLRKGMKLQTDPTVIYGMGDNYQGNISKQDLTNATDYNTYVINGLPPTPIAMVTKSALLAVAHPAVTNYLYFVADGTGKHKFSENLTEHNKAVKEYVKWYKQTYKQ